MAKKEQVMKCTRCQRVMDWKALSEPCLAVPDWLRNFYYPFVLYHTFEKVI
jgi:hypothetical protein